MNDTSCVSLLLEMLATSPAHELARIRPRVLAERLRVDEKLLTGTCLEACQARLPELHWDVICSTGNDSRIVRESLNSIYDHEHCSACDQRFEVDFSSTVELIFRLWPEGLH